MIPNHQRVPPARLAVKVCVQARIERDKPTTRQAHLPYSSSHRKAGSVGVALAAAAARALRSGAA